LTELAASATVGACQALLLVLPLHTFSAGLTSEMFDPKASDIYSGLKGTASLDVQESLRRERFNLCYFVVPV
jgi:hypothetical protein